jgi:hypothetical protein
MAEIQKESRMIIQLKKMLITLALQNPEWRVFQGMDLRSNSISSKGKTRHFKFFGHTIQIRKIGKAN